MIKTLVAVTREIDDIDLAVNEVAEQLLISDNLRKSTVGIITCHYEFVFSGVVEALGASLPFDIVGTITSGQAVEQEAGPLLLTLMVMTSDDVEFRTVLTDSLLGAPAQAIERAYSTTMGASELKPALIFSFASFLIENSGDEYVNVLTHVSNGTPCFGTLAVDDTATFENSFMIYNGDHYRDRMAMVLVIGKVEPKFYIATLSKDKVIDRPALITSSEGHILKEVNGRPLVEFFESLGLTKASETSYAMSSLPFMLDYGDGTPLVSKVFIGLTENRHGICAGTMPEGSTLYMGVFDKDDVLLTTGEALRRATQNVEQASGALIFSCVSRFMSLGAETAAELELVRESFAKQLPFMMAYSGGEICPTLSNNGVATNRFHNNAFILCIF